MLKSTISTGDALIKNHAGGVLGTNGTGMTKIITVTVPAPAIKIKAASVKANHFGVVELKWKMSGDTARIDHFVITAHRPGYTYPCGVRHHYVEQNNYTYIDTSQSRVIGSVEYSITPVFLSFARGKTVTVGTVAIIS